MDLIHEKDGARLGVIKRYTLDLAFGDSEENDFELEIPERFAYNVDGSMIEAGDCVFFPETEWGGIVDGMEYDTTGSYPTLTYTGRTWHGILSHKIIEPDQGEDYYIVSGTAQSILATLIDRLDVSGVFEAAAGDETQISYQFDRYTDAYTGIRKMLSQYGLRLHVERGLGLCRLSAVAVRDLSEGIDDNFLAFVMSQSRPVNHLICLGQGDLAERTVIHLYMGADGNVGDTQTFYGVDEIVETYDYSSVEDEEELESSGIERLQEYYEDSQSLEAEIPDELDARIGDEVTGSSVVVPLEVTATVAAITVKVENNGSPEVSYTVGSLKVL